MDNYNNKDLRSKNADYFNKPIEHNGWCAFHHPLSQQERHWVEEFLEISSWLAHGYNDDIFSFNVEAHNDWCRLRREYPDLFAEVNYQPSILRLYDQADKLENARQRHRRLGGLHRTLTCAEIAQEFPSLAASANVFAGGLIVDGFTVNVHKFCRKLITFLESKGAVFRWEFNVESVERNKHGRVTGVRGNGEHISSEHYVLSPGSYSNALLQGSPCANKIHGVLGGWLRIPNDQPQLTHSLKVSRKNHVTEDANVTIATSERGEPILILGSGYGYVGLDPSNIDTRQLSFMKQGIANTASILFPGTIIKEARDTGDGNQGMQYCTRPWTSTSLGIFHAEIMSDNEGLFVISGGHNTGGFAQSPAIANAVRALFAGEVHPMHYLYHPDRFHLFKGDAPFSFQDIPSLKMEVVLKPEFAVRLG